MSNETEHMQTVIPSISKSEIAKPVIPTPPMVGEIQSGHKVRGKSTSKVIFAALAASTMLLSGCVTDSGTYNRSSIGIPSEVLEGRLVGIEPINIQGRNTGIGAISGAALGGALGSNVGRNRRYGRGNAAAGIGFAILGGLVGSAIEQGATSSNGFRYTVELEDGRVITVPQRDRNPISAVGSPVRVEYGRFVRILPA